MIQIHVGMLKDKSQLIAEHTQKAKSELLSISHTVDIQRNCPGFAIPL